MTADIFIRSYAKDFCWLRHCLASVNKFGSGFHKIHIAIPSQDMGSFVSIVPPDNSKIHLVNRWENDYLGQQSDKMHADIYCAADFIVHFDSDCVFGKAFSPEDLMDDGKPVILLEKCDDSPWPEIAARTLGYKPEYEFMRRHPFIYHRKHYRKFREWLFNTHKMGLEQWIRQQPGNEFSEFNTFGAWLYENHRDEYVWKHPSERPVLCKQWWSWGGLTPEIQHEIDSILA